jgi:PhnB protein
MKITPHLTFKGQCRQAFVDYQRILGGKIITMMTYGESPMVAQFDASMRDQIIHATLELDDAELTGTDVPEKDFHKQQGFSVTISNQDTQRGREIFRVLADSGVIHIAFAPTFWSPGYGSLTDRYGIPWEINSSDPQAHIDTVVLNR